MSLTTPTTSQLRDTILAQIESSLSQTVPLLPKAALRVLAAIFAGVAIILYRYAGFIFLQLFVKYASFEATTVNGKTIRPLVDWGELIGEGPPDDGTQAQLVIAVTVVTQSGQINAGTLYTGQNGVTYSVVSSVLLNAASVSVTIRAVDDPNRGEGYGTIGNLANGSKVSLAVTLANVAREATVTSTAVEGAEPELEETYRQRVIQRFQRRPQGGAYADYWTWARDASGVVNVYPYASATPGVVEVYIESNVAPDGLAGAQLLADALALINLDLDGEALRKPVTAGAVTRSITRSALDIEVDGLEAPDPAATMTAISEGVDEWLRGREPFIEGLSVLPRKDRITQPEVAGVVAGIAAANGATYTSLTLKKAGIILTAYTLSHGEKAKLGTATQV